jgi:hypothetical protein
VDGNLLMPVAFDGGMGPMSTSVGCWCWPLGGGAVEESGVRVERVETECGWWWSVGELCWVYL